MTNAEREARVFRDELVRRLARDCMDAIEHVRRKRPDVRIWFEPFDSEMGSNGDAAIGVAIGERESSREDTCFIPVGSSRDSIVEWIVDTIKYVEEKRAAA